jgi:branched-chain amino acid transport system substrate-binding protein
MQKKKMIILAIILIAIIAISTVVALTQFVPSADARTIKIGLVYPSKSPIGTDMSRAAQLAVKEINDAGGIYVSAWHTKVQIELVNIDTQDDSPTNAVTAMTNGINGVDLLIGGYGSAGTLADEKVAIDERVPFIITGASNQLVTRRGPQGNYGGAGTSGQFSTSDSEGVSYMFHYCTTTYDYSKTVVDFFANTMKPLVAADRDFRLAILYRDDAFGQGVEQATKFWIQNESLPINVVADRKYTPTITNYQTDLTVVKEANPDAVFVVDNPDKTPLIIAQGLNDVHLNTVYIAVENNQDPAFYTALKSTGDGQLLESKLDPFMTPSYLPAVGTYATKFNATYGVMPGMMGADTYDAFYIAKDALGRAATVDHKGIRDAIESTNMNQMLILTQSGKIQFSKELNYHEISPITFIEQLTWDAATSTLKSQIVWAPQTNSGLNLKQADFTLPSGYQPGHE